MNKSELPPETPNPEREKERRMNALRAELLHYLQLLTRQAVSPGELEWQTEFTLGDDRQLIISLVKKPLENPGPDDTIGTVVISERLDDGHERHTTYEYKVAPVHVEKFVTTVAPRHGEAVIQDIKREIAKVLSKDDKKPGSLPLAGEQELIRLNKMLRALARRERLEE